MPGTWLKVSLKEELTLLVDTPPPVVLHLHVCPDHAAEAVEMKALHKGVTPLWAGSCSSACRLLGPGSLKTAKIATNL